MSVLTKKQTNVLLCIAQAMRQNGGPPTRKEIAEKLGFSSANAAQQHLKALERKGIISLRDGKSRGIMIAPAGLEIIAEHLGEEALGSSPINDSGGLPVVGKVAAGQPILSEAHIEDHYHIDPNIFNPAADYLLRVEGDSMKDCGILDGDLLAVKANPDQQPPENRQIVVARVDNEGVTVKRFYREAADSIVSLLPENPDFAPISVDLNQQSLNIEGFGVGVIRSEKRNS